ncbi:MAG: ethanolamine ammonia-lyase subunit EutB, partial [Bilophila wadsworthia]
RCYGLARRYQPFMVNTVVGFIGPEYLYNHQQIIRAALEDHFMGKLHGLPMGCDCCYTNHADTDQNSNENLMLLLAVAGVNFIISLPMGDDIMLNYQTNSFHDIATAALQPAARAGVRAMVGQLASWKTVCSRRGPGTPHSSFKARRRHS